ncbi:tRNA-i(6)A37 thiotransferase enzyme MiaB [Venenivibrio stagnispumantis]|uniref:tRNA-2-methylthio-N(6)-dimethylallyladenosine synthase n=1 Tax=Venenivibrio stagnispumantis TaxID=407998 RepID=A0AA45WJG2_9AQUI|nr:tRNA (N6-isopentenyl adenosine(37)-C2)-methylthiotransferase MiaB [Venenivibrio stagnispumantis]MCW4572445.1 tRNA (N6-isopentenyl adenosine(37)-C2)-methylthiotransferase MiaB [Venenivibrio stagnispumantis]SMP02987.1 tRNA-i(6)A37 thiotransferase enzyme MiaB [Venenivibrio stagnispumantis]
MKFYIRTFGCQMNVNDSEKMAGILKTLGYELAQDWTEADVILVNTCSVREKPDQKVLSALGEFKKIKKQNPNAIIGVCGCLAQRAGYEILQKAPFIDMVFGTTNIHHLPKLLQEAKEGNKAVEILEEIDSSEFELDQYPTVRENKYTAFVTVIRGCDKKCTYCIVPTTRGKERSRRIGDILREIQFLVEDGVKEIHLIGQNVTAYGKDLGDVKFYELLYAVADIKGVERIRFTTGHPRDLDEETIKAMADIPQVCEALHLPIQAGSDKILQAMDRGYTQKEYLHKIELLKKYIPDIALSTDIIVGFPGETYEDYLETIKVLKEVEYDQVFAFKYSPRPGTPAADMPMAETPETLSKWLNDLINMQKDITFKKNLAYENKVVEVLVEEQKEDGQYVGRTRTNKLVHFYGRDNLLGEIVDVKIEKVNRFSLEGVLN